MGQGEKKIALRCFCDCCQKLRELTFRLTFDKCSAKTNKSSAQFVDYAYKHNSGA